MSLDKPHYKVVAAAIFEGDSVYCFKKGKSRYSYSSYKFEFPGGKIIPGETQQEALIREIKEELKVLVEVKNIITTVNHSYPDFSLDMTCFKCLKKNGSFILNEHLEVVLKNIQKLDTLEWLDADIPIVKKIMSSYGK